MDSEISSTPLVTIGIPVFNGEQTISKLINSIQNQTFKNFLLIISDNASTDSTQKICQDFANNDSRIKYVRQKQNQGMIKNWNFVLELANTKYFAWIEADDYYHSEFLEKNINILESNENFVGSIGNTVYFDFPDKTPQAIHSIGSYEKKVKAYLKFNRGAGIFAVYRTKLYQKSTVYREFASWDLQIVLNVLKFGDLNVIDEEQHYRSIHGISSKSNILYEYRAGISLFNIIFPYSTTTFFCIKTLGLKFFFKNFVIFLRLNGNGAYLRTKDFIKLCKNAVFNRK
jgi:glycosyltransferase involved in cell wall biosynthesis